MLAPLYGVDSRNLALDCGYLHIFATRSGRMEGNEGEAFIAMMT